MLSNYKHLAIMNITELYDYAESSLAVNVPKANALKAKMICPVHRRKVLFTYDYLNDGTHAYITRYCCKEFAEKVAQAFREAQLFDHVEVEL